jgi:hypothetical protein
MTEKNILEVLDENNVKPELIEKMNSHSENVKACYEIFKECYKTAMRPTYVSDIVNGEIIETKPENIMVDSPVEGQYKLNEEHFERFCQFCTKNLYKYQKDSIRKIRELECRGYDINSVTGEKIISNGWLLSLPIGSGKSLVFQFLSLFYRDVPRHPIIISRDGRNVPDTEQAELKLYPFYYENCGYIEGQANGIITLEDYRQRRCTVILTHQHLLLQMKEYFQTDFPKVSKLTNIQYALDIHDVKDIDKIDILVIAATPRNVETLMAWSYDLPFMRVIIDDYTSMPSIESFRQIRASSTLFVSGSGFNRKESEIPASYYTLKFMPVPKITLVGKPEETFEGIFRDSIATMELMGSSCGFSQYKFVNECEEYCRLTFFANPVDVYPILRDEPLLQNYISLMFIIKNFDRIKGAISAVEHDLITINPKTNKPYLDKDRIKYYYEWKEMLADVKKRPPPKVQVKVKEGDRMVTKMVNKQDSLNPLYLKIYSDPSIGNGANSPTVPDAVCQICGKGPTENNGYGMLASCCGAFYCSHCIEESCTKTMVNASTGETIEDKDNYYCCCCRHKNPRFYFNVSRKKDTSIYAFNLAKEYYDVSELDDVAIFDYYFYMFKYGFKPLTFKGRALNIANDIQQGAVDGDCFKLNKIPELDKILPKDQLAILALSNINTTLHRLKILPKRGSIIMFYGCPNYMQERVKFFYNDIKNKNNPATVFQVRTNRGEELIQPITQTRIVFKDDVGSLIGLHENIIAIIAWETPTYKDQQNQLFGRVLRLNGWGNPLTFYISTNSISYE